MSVKVNKLFESIIAIVFAFWTVGGSLYYKAGLTPVYGAVIVAIIATVFLINRKKLTINNWSYLIFLMCVLVVFRNADIELGIWNYSKPIIFLTTVVVTMLVVQTKDFDVWKIYFSVISLAYIGYAFFTYLYFFNRQVFEQINFKLFPTAIYRMQEQYSQGCMCGLTSHYSTNGMLLASGSIIFGCYALFSEKKKLYRYLAFVFVMVALLLTGKRAHVFFTLIALFYTYFLYISKYQAKKYLIVFRVLIGLLLAYIVASFFFPDLLVSFNRAVSMADTEDMTLGRVDMWNTALNGFLRNPLLGIGWGQARYLSWLGMDIHNIYVQILTETGIVGGGIWLCWFSSFFLKTSRLMYRMACNASEYRNMPLLAFSVCYQAYFLLYGLTGNPLYEKENYVLYFVSCGIYVMLKGYTKEHRERIPTLVYSHIMS